MRGSSLCIGWNQVRHAATQKIGGNKLNDENNDFHCVT